MNSKFQQLRFHVISGPPALFTRVRQKMAGARTLTLKTKHFGTRAESRFPPVSQLEAFDASEWDLMTADVRSDTGKFMRSAWRKPVNGDVWWIVIGVNDTIVTAYPEDIGKTGFGPDIVRDGPMYTLVEEVNAKLVLDHVRSAAASDANGV